MHGISHFQCQSCVIEEWNSFSSWTGNCHFQNLLLTLSARIRRWAKTTHLNNRCRYAVIYSRIKNSGYKLNENMSKHICLQQCVIKNSSHVDRDNLSFLFHLIKLPKINISSVYDPFFACFSSKLRLLKHTIFVKRAKVTWFGDFCKCQMQV